MEMLDIVDENGEPTGKVKERTKVHEDGDRHRTSHVWIVRDNEKSGMDILLQKRSENKDSYPGCYDISSAGHIPAGCEYIESALRELKEELGIDVDSSQLKECGIRRLTFSDIFHGKKFNDNQVTKVFRIKCNNLNISELNLQKEEVESVMWMDYNECMKAIQNNSIKNCIYTEELEMIR